jgi:PAS domain S-box-containing protein
MFGYELDEFLGQSALILYADDQEAYSALGRVAGPVLSEGKPFRAEVQLKRRDGSLFWCRVSAKAVDPELPRDGTLWIIEDMTDDHRMLEALERSTRELTAILDTASVGIAVVRNREFVRCNRRFEELFDLERGLAGGESSARVLFDSDEEFERIGQQVYAEFAAGQVHHREQLHRRSDGGLSGCVSAAASSMRTTPHAGSVWLTEDVHRHARGRGARAPGL